MGAFGVLGYIARAGELREHIEAYCVCGVDRSRIEVVLRPFPPDITPEHPLESKLEVLRGFCPARIDLYNLGFARQRDLAMASRAIART